MPRPAFANGEHYHIYNRGVDKRTIFLDQRDAQRFFQSMEKFNSAEPIGSLYLNSFRKLSGRTAKSEKKLVDIIAYCLNPNHFHLILRQLAKDGISEYMKRLGGGYAWYFNNKYKRSGVLFQGRYKAIHINSNRYLLYVSAYVNLNNRAHSLKNPLRSSWQEYTDKGKSGPCKKEIILTQFENTAEYIDFAEDAISQVMRNKMLRKELESFIIE